MKEYHVMVDIETIGVSPEAVVLTVGMVKFDPNSLDEPFDGVHIKLSPTEQKKDGRAINRDTLEWWSAQDPKVREQAFGPENQFSVRDGLAQIIEYFNVLDSKDHNRGPAYFSRVWGQGYGFDMTILKNLFRQYDMIEPWKYYQERDSRTLFSLLDKDPRPEEGQDNRHNALSDAYYQAIGVQRALHFLKSK